jgi:hypothetical protein
MFMNGVDVDGVAVVYIVNTEKTAVIVSYLG